MSPLETPLDVGIALHGKVDGSDAVYSLYPITRDIDVALTTLTDDNALTLDDKIAIYDEKHANTEQRLVTLESDGISYVYGELKDRIGHEDSISVTENDDTKVLTLGVVSSPKLTTARTLTIGSTGKTFDGTDNIVWTLDEIGAAASSHSHNYLNAKGQNTIDGVANDTTSNWGAQGNSTHFYSKTGALTNQPSQYGLLVNFSSGTEVHQLWLTQNSGDIKHRSGNASGWEMSWTTLLDSNNYKSFCTPSNIGAASSSHTHNYAGSSSAGGSATSAVKLATARTINGTSFNGSANITTANWGTSRTITIGNTGKSVNGSGNVSWTLAEIGAAASSHSHSYLPLSGGTMTGALNFANGTYNTVGDDVAIGDINIGGCLGIMGKNGNTAIQLVNYGASITTGTNATGVRWTCTGNGKSTISGTTSGTFSGSLSGNASSATKATQDGNGNTITSTYALKNNPVMTGAMQHSRKSGSTVGVKSFTWGYENNTASGTNSFALGYYNTSTGDGSFAMGRYNTAGNGTIDNTITPVAIGQSNTASATYAVAIGQNNNVSTYASAAIGADNTVSTGNYSVAIGSSNTLSSTNAYGFGDRNTAVGMYGFAKGYYAYACQGQETSGHFNTNLGASVTSGSGAYTAFVIGNGTSNSARSNAFRVRYDGVVYSKGAYNASGADYAEYFEWEDKNENNEDRRGYFVTFSDGNKIKKANNGDYILGVVSGNPCVVGNSDEHWRGQYKVDEFGAYILEERESEYEDTELIENADGSITENTVTKTRISTFYVENPDYDTGQEYISREDRPEWDAIGMIGVLSVIDDGTCKVNGYCTVKDGGIGTGCELANGANMYRVIERVSDNIIKIVFR